MSLILTLVAISIVMFLIGFNFSDFKKLNREEKLQGFGVMAFMFVLIVVEGLLN